MRVIPNNTDYTTYQDMSCNSFIEYLLTLDAYELSLLATGLGFFLCNNLDANKQNSLGCFFELIGQLLVSVAAQNNNLYPSNSESKLTQEINYLKSEIARLKKMTKE